MNLAEYRKLKFSAFRGREAGLIDGSAGFQPASEIGAQASILLRNGSAAGVPLAATTGTAGVPPAYRAAKFFNLLLVLSVFCASFASPSLAAVSGDPPSPESQSSPSDSSIERDLKGFATVTDTMPMYLSQISANGFRMDAGSRFVVILETGISSSTANIGDLVTAKLAAPISYAGETVAQAGSPLTGTIFLVDKSRNTLKSDLPGKHWLNAQGGLGIRFDKLTAGKRTFTLNAIPAAKAMVSAVATPTRSRLVTDKNGDITVYYGSGKYAGLALGIEGASIATGPFGLLIGPALSGIAGAASPSYAVGHPYDTKGFKERTKGFLAGMVKGLPGGGIVTGAVEHGYDVVLVPGDKIILELKEDATLM